MKLIKRCAIYARFSTDKQSDMSAEAQVLECKKHAAKQGWSVAVGDIYEEKGISGAAIGNRPHLNEMIASAKRGEFDVLLVNDLTRLARSQDCAVLVSRLRFRGIRVLGIQDGFDSDASHAGMQAGISGIMSEETRKMISMRTHSALEMRAENGKNAGGRPFGYVIQREFSRTELDDHNRPKLLRSWMEKDPKTAPIVERAFCMYADEGVSPQQICVVFNAEGIKSPRGGKWLPSALATILRNPVYKGSRVWNRTKGVKDPDSGKITYVARPKDELVERFIPELVIVDERLWERAQQREAARCKPRGAAISAGIKAASGKRIGGRDSRYALGGILRCGCCGANLIGDSLTDFICPRFVSGACANDMRVRREEANEKLYKHLREHLLSDTAIAAGIKVVEAELREREGEERAACKPSKSKELEKLEKEFADLRESNPAAWLLTAAQTALDAKRSEIAAKATVSGAAAHNRARALLARVPKIVLAYQEAVENGLKALSKPEHVAQAREALKKLLVDGRVDLKPDPEHTGLTGQLEFVAFGDHLMDLAGWRRKAPEFLPSKAKLPTSQVSMVAGA